MWGILQIVEFDVVEYESSSCNVLGHKQLRQSSSSDTEVIASYLICHLPLSLSVGKICAGGLENGANPAFLINILRLLWGQSEVDKTNLES